MSFTSSSGIQYEEFLNNPIIHFNKDGIALKTEYLCSWDDSTQLVNDLLADAYLDPPESGILVRTPPHAYQFNGDVSLRAGVFCVSATVEPLRDDKASENQGSNAYTKAKVTADYSSLPYAVGTNPDAPGGATDLGEDGFPFHTSISINFAGKDIPIPKGGFYFEGFSPTDPNAQFDGALQYALPMATVLMTRYGVPYDIINQKNTLTRLVGTVNDDLDLTEFTTTQLAGFDPGTLRLLTVSYKSTHTPLGDPSWEITYAMLYLPQGHQFFPYLKGGGVWPNWKRLLTKPLTGEPDTGGSPVFAVADWTQLFK